MHNVIFTLNRDLNSVKMNSSITRLLFRPQLVIIHSKTFTSTILENVTNTTPILEGPCDTKLLKVAIIGIPNAGKSTFINSLMDRKVCATSHKVHTTRSKAKAIFSTDDTQIVFIDTPGLVNQREQKKFNLTSKFIRDSKNIAHHVDVIGVIHDVSNFWTRDRLDIKIVNILEGNKNKPSFLVINKVDALKSKRKLLDVTRNLTENAIHGKPIEIRGSKKEFKEDELNTRGWPYFSDIFMVSALTGDGIDDVKNYLLSKAKPGKWLFPGDVWTDQNAELVIVNTVKAALLNHMPQEVPYKLEPAIEYFNVDENGKITASVTVKCPTARLYRLLLGASEGRIRNITESVQRDLQDCFHNFVKIKIVPSSLGVEINN